jgi:hypothetical protein
MVNVAQPEPQDIENSDQNAVQEEEKEGKEKPKEEKHESDEDNNVFIKYSNLFF